MAEKSVAQEQPVPNPSPIAAEIVDTLAADPVGLKSAVAEETGEDVDDIDSDAVDTTADTIESEATVQEATASDAIVSKATASKATASKATASETETAVRPIAAVAEPVAASSESSSHRSDPDAAGSDAVNVPTESSADPKKMTVETAIAAVTVDDENDGDNITAEGEARPSDISGTDITDLERLLAQSQMREHALKNSLSDMQTTIGEQQQQIAQLRASTEKMAALQQELSEAKDYIRRLSQQASPSAQVAQVAQAAQVSQVSRKAASPAPPASQGRPLVPNPPMRPGSSPWTKPAAPRPSQRPAPASQVPSAAASLPPMSTETGSGLSTLPNVVPPQRPKQTPKKKLGLQRYTRPGIPSNRPARASEMQPSQPPQSEPQRKLTDADIGWFD